MPTGDLRCLEAAASLSRENLLGIAYSVLETIIPRLRLRFTAYPLEVEKVSSGNGGFHSQKFWVASEP